jgi:hypothetical protein
MWRPDPAQLALQGFDALHRRLEVLLEKLLEDFHDERDLTLGAQREMAGLSPIETGAKTVTLRDESLPTTLPSDISGIVLPSRQFVRPYFCVALIPPK